MTVLAKNLFLMAIACGLTMVVDQSMREYGAVRFLVIAAVCVVLWKIDPFRVKGQPSEKKFWLWGRERSALKYVLLMIVVINFALSYAIGAATPYIVPLSMFGAAAAYALTVMIGKKRPRA